MKKFLFYLLFFSSFNSFQMMAAESAPIRILVGSPIRRKPAILHEFLLSLQEVKKSSYSMDYFFIDDNVDPKSSQLLQNFAQNQEGNCLLIRPDFEEKSTEFICNEITHYWNEALIWKVADFKDQMIQYALNEGYDYIFLIDSDIVLHPETIEHLLMCKKEIVCDIFWTACRPNALLNPQVWLYDEFEQYQIERGKFLSQAEMNKRLNSFYNMLKYPGTYEVGGMGACTLISRSALEKGISFQEIKNLTFIGEDRHFCIRAAALGIDLFVDTHYPAYHIYRDTDLLGVDAFKKICENKIANPKEIDDTFYESFAVEMKNPSSIFYLAESYLQEQNLELSLKTYEKRIQMGGWEQEIFWAKYQIGCIQQNLCFDPDIFLASYWQAYLYRPSRIEPLFNIVSYYRLQGDYEKGYAFAKLGIDKFAPKNESFVLYGVYDWGLLLEFSICAYWLEKYEEAEEASYTLLANPNLPLHVKDCVKRNLEWINKSIPQSKYLGNTIKGGQFE